jgi:hypothetical protein
LLLIGEYVSALSILKGIAGLMVLGVVVRLMIRVVMRAAAGSVHVVGICIRSFNVSNSDGVTVDSLLDGAGAAKKGTEAES